MVTDEKGSSIKDVSFEVTSDGKTKIVKPDNNSAINFGVEENKTYTIKLISNVKYEMEDVTFTCIKGVSDFGTPIYRLMNGNIEIKSLLLKNKESQPPVQPIEKEFTFDVLCGSCGNAPIAKELSFEVIGRDNNKVTYKSNSGVVKFKLVENEEYNVKLVEDVEYELSDIKINVKKLNGELKVYKEDGTVLTEFVMKKKSTGNCVEDLCDFSDKKITMSEIPIKVLEDDMERDLKPNEVVTFNLYNATKQERVAEIKTINGKLPALEVYEKDDYILFTSDKNKDFIMADAPFIKEVSELYFRANGDGNLPIRHKTKNPYATGAHLNIERIVVRPLETHEKINEKYKINYVRIKQDKNNPQDYSKVKVIFTSEYDTVVATTLPEDEWGVPLTPIELYENVQYSVRIEDPDNKFAIENFPFTLVDKSERGPNHPKKWGDGKYVFDHSSCGNATFLNLVKKGTENDNNTRITCSNGNTTVSGMNFKDLKLQTIRPDKSLVKGLEGKDFDLFRFKLINVKRCEVSKMADGNFVIHRTIKDGKIAKNVYQVEKDGSLTKLTFNQIGNIVDINTKTLSIYDTVIEYKEENSQVEANKESLQQAVDKAKNPETTKDKTDESIEAMNKALAKAEEVLAKEDATQEEVNKAEKDLRDAINSLVDKPQEPEVEKVELKNEDSSIVVSGDTNTLEKDWKLLTKGVNPSELVGKEYDSYDINLKDANNREVQPKGEVTVTIKVKAKVEKLYHIDGRLKEIPFTYENGEVTFKTNHFSVYAVVYGDKQDDNNKPGEDNNKPENDNNKPGEDNNKPGNDNNKPGQDVKPEDNSKKNRTSKKANKLPKTNISNVSYALTSILALGVVGVIGYKRKDEE
ncbi:LPXTG-motif cell wall anchor domain protein [Parvimonas sp. oral taxon 393 str. F0440]|nr:LPXTG-motif cell wall anchor domain protein [Parvimonas sp. oral taxon 393 str. F0440]